MNLKFSPKRHFKLNMHGAFGYSLSNWFYVLYKNKFDIDFLAIPKVIWITFGILSTSVFSVYESLRFRSSINKTEIKSPVFIIGYYRSGTTFLHYLLSKDKQFSYCAAYQVLMPHIFLTLNKWIERNLIYFMPKKRLMDNMKLHSNLPKEEEFALSALSNASIVNGYYFPKNIKAYFDNYVLFRGEKKYEAEWKSNLLYFLKKVSINKQDKKLLIKSPLNTGRIKQILELFPDAKFIHIHRNPYEVYYSNVKLYESILPAFAFHKVENEQMEDFILDSYRFTYQKYFDEVDLIPQGNLATISYEELTKNAIPTLAKVYKELDILGFNDALPEINKELATYNNYKVNKHVYNENSDGRIDLAWGKIIAKLGYKTIVKSSDKLESISV